MSNPTVTVTVIIAAARYADHDDCLEAARSDYAATNGLEDWHVEADWAEDSREEIVLTVDSLALYRARTATGEAPEQDDVDEAAEALAADGGEVLHPQRTTDQIAIVRTAEGAIVGIGGDGSGGAAWAVELVPAP